MEGILMPSDSTIFMSNIEKKFGGIYALRGVNLSIKEGTVHAVVGENGAGKSTLVKILTGVVAKDSGQIYVDGEVVEIKDYIHAQKLGIAIVPQELDLVDYFTVGENIFLGREPRIKGTKLIDWKRLYKETEQILTDLDINLNPKTKVGELGVSDKQMVVIARILSQNARVIIMDEPTARLGYNEIDVLLKYIKYLREKGKSIIYISHRLEEIFKIADEVTVLRDGTVVGNKPIDQLDQSQMIQMMVNRKVELTDEFVQGRTYSEEILRVENLSRSTLVKDVSFSLRKGEVLGFFGLVGAGRTEMIRSMLGVDKKISGDIYLEGKKMNFKDITDSIKAGIALVPEERRQQGLVLSLPINVNVTLGNLKEFTKKTGLLDKKREKSVVKNCVDKVALNYRGLEQRVSELSGGNQQKVVLSKLIARGNVKIYIFDEPTRGIDVGAKSEIYRLISEIAKTGTPVIVISSEIPEIQALCDRVVIMYEGKVKATLDREKLKSSENILKYAIGG
jgi:ABC-type sugar transport system ATPase subunit